MNRITLPPDGFRCRTGACGKRTLEYTGARISFTFTTNSETTFPRRYTAGGVKKQYANMLTPWLWHGGHTPGYKNCCILGYAFFNISPFKISWESPCRGGMHKCIPYEKIRRFSIQHTAADYSPGGMHQCTSRLSVGNGFIRSERCVYICGRLNGIMHH